MKQKRKDIISKIGVNNYVDHSMSILDRINELLVDKFNGKQAELAKKLGKKESEISKWLNGVQNFTIFTISKLEEAFGESIIAVCTHENDENYDFVQIKSYKKSKVNLVIDTNGRLDEQYDKFENIADLNLPKKLPHELPA